MTTKLHISAVDAETNSLVGLLESGAEFSAAIFPVAQEIPAADLEAALAAFAAEPANGPIPPEDPPDKPVTGAPGFGPLGNILTEPPRIVRIGGALAIQFEPAPQTGGWYVAAVPSETDDYEIEPRVRFIAKAPGDIQVPFTFYRRDLTPLAREVLVMRQKARVQLAIVSAEWEGETAGVWDMVHNYVENTLWPPEDERLRAYWIGWMSWAVLDFAVPARDFDLLMERTEQIMTALADVPWPDLPFFERCAYGVPITQGTDGAPLAILNWRIAVPKFSDYFPRETHQVKTDLGTLWLANLEAVFTCVLAKAADEAEDAKRTAKFWAIAGAVAPMLILPTPIVVAGTVWDLASANFLQNANPALLAALNAAKSLLVSLVSGGAAVPGFDVSGKVMEAMTGVIRKLLENQGLAELKELAKDIEKLKGLVQGSLGLGELPPVLKPFIVWCLRVSVLDVLLAQILSEILGTEVDPQETFTFPMLADAEAAGVPVPASLTALANGEDSNFPAQAPSGWLGAIGGAALLGTEVLTVLQLTGTLRLL